MIDVLKLRLKATADRGNRPEDEKTEELKRRLNEALSKIETLISEKGELAEKLAKAKRALGILEGEHDALRVQEREALGALSTVDMLRATNENYELVYAAILDTLSKAVAALRDGKSPEAVAGVLERLEAIIKDEN